MSEIKALGVDDILPGLPELRAFSADYADMWTGGVFLCALGFEERCLAIPQRLEQLRAKFRFVSCYEYDINRADNEVNRPELERCLRALGEFQPPMSAGGADLEARLSAIGLAAQGSRAEPPLFVVDISSFADWLLIRVVGSLLHLKVRMVIIYSEAATYFPTKEEFESERKKWCEESDFGLEWGVEDIGILRPGLHLDSVPDCIAVFPTFNAMRSKVLISVVDPALLSNTADKVHWLVGVPHLAEDSWRTEALVAINALDDQVRHLVSTFDYKDSIRTLHRIAARFWDKYKITVAPLGSKMQSVGVTLFAIMHPEVRIMLSMPREYNAARYSKGCKAIWVLDLGNAEALRSQLLKVGCLVVDD